MVVVFEKRIEAMWARIEELESANKDLRIELGRQTVRIDKASEVVGELRKAVNGGN